VREAYGFIALANSSQADRYRNRAVSETALRGWKDGVIFFFIIGIFLFFTARIWVPIVGVLGLVGAGTVVVGGIEASHALLGLLAPTKTRVRTGR
jgi:hypothetical protein